jgi:hypothetical protein
MRILGNLVFAGLGQVQNLRVENVATDPVTPMVGQVWYNTAEGFYKGYDGTTVITFASGGNTDLILEEVDRIETAAGLSETGTYAQHTDTNYINGATNLKAADKLLDAQLKTATDAAATAQGAADDAQAELDLVEAAAGLNTDGTYSAHTDTNYINGAGNLKAADKLLDTAVKNAADAASGAQSTADLKVSKSGDSMTGNLAMQNNKVIGVATPTDAGDAVNKAYVDAIASGLTWEAPVDGVVADHTAIGTALVAGQRFANTTDDKIYTVTADGADGATAVWNAGELLVDGAAFFDKSVEAGYVFNGAEIVQFSGLGQVTAGIGLVKTGNVMDINLGAGIGQLPSDEVGIDILAAGGLFLTVDGTAASTDSAAQLSVKIDGSTLSRSGSGVKVADAGVTETQLAASVAGAGLTGGAGAALAVGAGTGIVVDADTVALDLTYADGRYINVDGDTMTGSLTLAADPTTALMAATKQYVDSVTTALEGSTVVYDGSVASASHVVTHNIGSQFCNVTVVDSANKQIIPDSVTFDSANQLTVAFSSAITCKIVVTGKYVAA